MPSIFGFVDGAYFRRNCLLLKGSEWFSPRAIVDGVIRDAGFNWDELRRVNYYDAPYPPTTPSESAKDIEGYWHAVERELDTTLRFGSLRGKSKKMPAQQKGVDVLLAVDLVVGSFTKLFGVAVLVTGDADFIPAIQEAQRCGVRVALGAFDGHVGDELGDACARFTHLNAIAAGYLPTPVTE